jgi:hypothetical protein
MLNIDVRSAKVRWLSLHAEVAHRANSTNAADNSAVLDHEWPSCRQQVLKPADEAIQLHVEARAVLPWLRRLQLAFRKHRTPLRLRTPVFASVVWWLAVGCSSHGGAEGSGDAPTADVAPDAPPDAASPWSGFDMGVDGPEDQMASFQTFRLASGALASEPRFCHKYTGWNVATGDVSGLVTWLAGAAPNCDEVMMTFKGSGGEQAPSAAQMEAAFVAFQHLTDPGQPLADWNGKISFTACNEPNNGNSAGSGFSPAPTPELAAQYYLAIRKHCSPDSGCKVAAGDFATNGNWWNDLQWNCADDNDPANTTTHCAHPSSYNTTGAPPSYLDRYKNYIANHATSFGLPAGFRPEYLAYHPWHDVNEYIEHNNPCSTYQNCATRRLLESLGGTWSGVELWDDEISVGLQTSPAPNENTTQPCGAAFLVQLTNLSPRFRRLYYMWYSKGNGPLLDGNVLRPAGVVLANRETSYSGATCPPTGM